MKRRRITAVCLMFLVPIVWYAVVELTDKRNADEVRYDRLVSARRSEARFMLWRMRPWYARLSKLTRFDPFNYYQDKADGLEKSLLKSGALVYVSFYNPAPSASKMFPLAAVPYIASAQHPKAQYVRIGSDKDEISLTCRPRDVSYWQTTFSCITNRVNYGKLYKMVGNREETECHLPDDRVVDLNTCHQWLNESIASDWMVGVCASNRILIVSRQKKPIGFN